MFSSCSTDKDSSSNPASDTSENSEETSSESLSSEVIDEGIEYTDNPMNDPLIHNQYYLNHIGDIYSVWKKYRGTGITIAVIDEGFESEHEDFVFKNGKSKVSDKSAYFSTTAAGKTSHVVGIDKVKAGEASHGTFCAGIAAAGLNNKGVVGIAPEANLLLLKTDMKPKSVAAAFKYAADNGAKVITISIGSYASGEGDLQKQSDDDLTTMFDEPVKYCTDKGIVVVSAAGNGGEAGKPTIKTYPGATKGIIGAAGLAANSSKDLWTGTSYNPSSEKDKEDKFCDIFAPSEGMYGCANYGTTKYDGGYIQSESKYKWNGTSFSSPIIAGVAALYLQRYPSRGVTEFKRDLYASATKISNDYKTGYGRVDVGKLMGMTSSEKITVKIKNTGNLNAYCWNSITNAKESAWPGKALSKSGGYYSVTIDTSKFDSVIFNDGETQTVDLLASSFSYGNAYNLDVEGMDYHFIGQYTKN